MEVTHGPSDEEIRSAVFNWLKSADASQVTKKDLKRHIENNNGWNLDDRKDILKSSLLDFFEEQGSMEEEADEEEDDDAPPQQQKKKGGGGFSAPVQLSDRLSEFFDGEVVLPRSEVTKRIWAHIREHNLQDPSDRRVILCDDKLERVLGTRKLNMFRLTKLLSQHLKSVAELQSGPLPEKVLTAKKPKPAAPKKSRAKASSSIPVRGRGNGLELSAGLQEMLGYRVLPRTQVTKLIWDYIKAHNLQKESDRRYIVCDQRMLKLFQVKEFTMFEMTKFLNQMMSKTDEPVDEEYMEVWAARDKSESEESCATPATKKVKRK
ncbi:TRI1 [Symbiodinium microadriaticum]|nr:TRI1 [Symbiodinium microadriaticum]